nr:hypothetical protein [Tanacetum cinerariifolium]
MGVEKKCTHDDVRVWASISSSQSISPSLHYAIPVAISAILQFGEILLDVFGVTTFIACSCLLILVVVVVVVIVGIDPTIIGRMTIPLAVSILGGTLPGVVVIALGAQSGGNVNQGTKGGRYKAPIHTSIKRDCSIMVVEKKCTHDDVRVWASISSSQSIGLSLHYAIPVSIFAVLQFGEILFDVSGVTTFIACSCLLILVVVVVVVIIGIDSTIIGRMTIPLTVSTLGGTLPGVVVIALDKAILSGADNRPPMLEKDMYESWKSRMELYMLNRQHGRMIFELVERGPLLWTTIEEDGVTRLKKYSESAEAIQADCDVKVTNIILKGLAPEVYALVSTHKVAKELWERIQMLMQGTSLTKQEKECKLYDEFDKFSYRKEETLRDFYLRFSLLLNDMNMYNMKLEQFQVNTKFLNTLPPEWSKFVTDVKLVRDLHTTNVDQLHTYLGQHEYRANESSPFATSYHTPQFVSQGTSSSNMSISYPVNDISSTVNHNAYMASSSAPQIDYAPMVHHSSEYSSPETGLVVLIFPKGDDPIDAINHMMSFLTAVVTLRYPATNN